MSDDTQPAVRRLSVQEIHEIYSAINFWDDEWTPGATAAVERIVAEHYAAGRRDGAVEAWDEVVQAVAWAMDNGPTGDALRYVADHNPYKKENR